MVTDPGAIGLSADSTSSERRERLRWLSANVVFVLLFTLIAAAAAEVAPGPGRERAKVVSVRSVSLRAVSAQPALGPDDLNPGDLRPYLDFTQPQELSDERVQERWVHTDASGSPVPPTPSRAPPSRG